MPDKAATLAGSELQGLSLLGSRVASGRGREFHALNPADSRRLPPAYHSATREELDVAARLAAEAFPIYSRLPGKPRAAFLRSIAKNIEEISQPLVARATRETGLPVLRLQGETARTCNQLRLFADLVEEGSWVGARIDPALPERQPLPRPDVRSMLRPLGPIAVFAASNFPIAFSVAGGDTASALAAGNPVIVKAHAAHPGTSELVGRAVLQAVREHSLPQGVFSLLFDAGFEIGTALVQHPAIKAVAFTGSRAGGDALRQATASRSEPIPVFAEMGSVNPVFILPGAMRERGQQIAAGLHASMTLGAGQFCTKPGLVLLANDEPARHFARKLSDLVAGPASFTLLTPGIQAAYKKGVAQRSQAGSAQKLAEGPAPTGSGCAAAAAIFQADAEEFLRDPRLGEELFGPSTLLINYSTREQLLELARGLEGHLTATLHGTEQDLADYRDLVEILETKVGRIIFNGFPTGVEVCHAMVHGGPYPATSDGRSTSVGTLAILRFARPVCFQGFPQPALPPELQDSNPLGIWRLVDGRLTRDPRH
ncbi:MAG TPA: aldehyde dehydrogenase (NADP(+)) [Terriglobales bacterium]|nr:aldehyde dehydrogenase (NADP(+)) [Terriglobales bacterium]